jgi:4-hydroxy-3-polyprenylbenzoate decarboxylase
MPFRDLREFLQKLEEIGELKRVKAEVDWNEEIAAIVQENAIKRGPALIFENIKDYKNTACRKLTMDSLGSFKRISLALDLPLDSHPRDILNIWRERTKSPIKPILVSTGPCKEVIKKGDDINIFDFPVPKLHPLDGGRYTIWQCNITKDPETGWVNVGMYNGMLYDKRSIVVTYRFAHSAVQGKKYKAMGQKRMPYAIAIGTEPVLSMAACAPFDIGVCEYDMAGALRKEPIELVKCETVDLEVPATAEIVIEGTISLDRKDFKTEGPFGRFTGYYYGLKPFPSPVLDITCITHRNDPIFIDTLDGTGADLVATEEDYVSAINSSAALWDYLERNGIRGVTGVWMDPDMIWTNIFVSINKQYYGHAKHVAAALWGYEKGNVIGKYIVVVDSDVDIFNLKKINSAIANRTRGQKDVIIFPYGQGAPTDPGIEMLDSEGKIKGWDRVLIDATWPMEWQPREEWGGLNHPPSVLARSETIEKVRKRWNELGI